MADLPTKSAFAQCLGNTFHILRELSIPLEVVLIEVAAPRRNTEVNRGPGNDRPFSLLLRGPPSPTLAQGIYRVEHERLGGHPLFLVPVGPDAAGMRYEVVFN